jgi:hypothetical protein
MSIASAAGREVQGVVARKVAGNGVKAAAREAGSKVSAGVARTAGDVLLRSGQKAVEQGKNPLFEALMAKINAEVKQGAFTATVLPELKAAAAASTSTAEALRVAKLAQDLTLKNKVNQGGMMEALKAAIDRAATTEEAHVTLKAIVKARTDAFALFRLTEATSITTGAVDKLMRSGPATDDLAKMAIATVKRPMFGAPQKISFKAKSWVEKPIEDKIARVAHYLNAILRG